MGRRTNLSANRLKANSKIQQVFKDFGVGIYERDKNVAFATWWRKKVSETETRGDQLFAEPLVTNKMDSIDIQFQTGYHSQQITIG